MTHSNRAVAALAGIAIAVGAQAFACQAGGGAGRAGGGGTAWAGGGGAVIQHATSATARAAAVRYWTPARMGAALGAPKGTPSSQRQPVEPPAGRARRLIRQLPAPQATPAPVGRLGAPGAPAGRSTGGTAGNGVRWSGRGPVAAAIGKIFFTLGRQDYVCSGTLIGGKHPDVVLTAAHCVTSGPGAGRAGKNGAPQWATNWMFVPGFVDGQSPYGEYTARRFLVSPHWTGPESGREQYDTAFVQVATATLSGAAGPWASATAQPPPGLPVTFAADQDAVPLSQTYLFGYPSELPYTGLYLNYCAGPVVASGGSVRTACGMTAGDSGGPWLAGFSPRSGSGTIAAVSTYKVSSDTRVLYGAALGPEARALYERAVRLARQSGGPARSPYRSARPPNA